MSNGTVALILCGALAREVIAISAARGWDVALFGVSAGVHLRPERIAPEVEARLRELIPRYERLIVVFADCGSYGRLDAVLERYNVPRLAGPHCYELYAGAAAERLIEEEPGTFFLTDFLVRGFNGALRRGLGLDRHPELRDLYFANYRRLVYLVQRPDEALLARAGAIAAELGLPLEVRRTGYGELEARLAALMETIHDERFRPRMPEAEEESSGDLPDPLLARHPAPGAGPRRGRARRRPAAAALPGGGGPGGDAGGPDGR
jgi:hypothetical protein